MIIDHNKLLFIAGFGSMVIALFHIAMIYVGPSAYRYFGAGEKMVKMSESRSLYPTIITSGITLVFMVFSLYAFSGAELIQPLPFLKPFLIAIGAIYTLRGLFAIYFTYLLISTRKPDFYKDLTFSLISLVMGLFYLGGVYVKIKENF